MTKSELIQIPEGIDKSAEFVEFCKWSAQPKDVRQPNEQKLLANELRVDETTLVRWKEYPEFAFNKRNYIREWLGDDLPDVMQIVKRGALRGQDRKIELFLKWLGELSEGMNVNVGIAINQTPLTDEQRADYSIGIVNKLMGTLVEIKDGKVVRK